MWVGRGNPTFLLAPHPPLLSSLCEVQDGGGENSQTHSFSNGCLDAPYGGSFASAALTANMREEREKRGFLALGIPLFFKEIHGNEQSGLAVM